MKHFHGRRHIRARKSVAVGRRKRLERKMERVADNLRLLPMVITEAARYTEEIVKALDIWMKQFHYVVSNNGDGTYTHTWNFEEKG